MKALNVISFDVPYPPNYGGIVDVYYKLKSLSKAGVQLHLHCFEYGRGRQNELNKICSTVTYYKRSIGPKSLLSKLPYIVKSRQNPNLKMNLLANAHPILFEGLHTCYLLNDPAFKNRLKLVRTHNIEHEYYKLLGKNEINAFKRKFFKTESKKLNQFEAILNHANHCLSISKEDQVYFEQALQETKVSYLPAFHAGDKVNCKTGRGDYVLYHGNLSVVENAQAAKYLLENIFTDGDLRFVIAGLNPPNWLQSLAQKTNSVHLIQNPSDEELLELIQNAHVNYLYTNQATGLKLKLLHALFNGRHLIVNSTMVHGSQLNDLCHVQDDPEKSKILVQKLMKVPFEASDQSKRINGLIEYDNSKNAQKIIDLMG